jgi:hypothetical protein
LGIGSTVLMAISEEWETEKLYLRLEDSGLLMQIRAVPKRLELIHSFLNLGQKITPSPAV